MFVAEEMGGEEEKETEWKKWKENWREWNGKWNGLVKVKENGGEWEKKVDKMEENWMENGMEKKCAYDNGRNWKKIE